MSCPTPGARSSWAATARVPCSSTTRSRRPPSPSSRRSSAPAGFVAPGESLEEAVAREVYEEARVRIGPPVYMASQPWPFPASLMLGFHAAWVDGEPDAGEEELQDARWFDRAQVAQAAREDTDARWGTRCCWALAEKGWQQPGRLA